MPQSAHCTSSRISRGAPPSSGTCASVPLQMKRPAQWRSSESAIWPERGHRQDLRVGQRERARLRALGARREEAARLAFPGRAVDHGLAVGGEAGGEHGSAPERQALEGGEAVAARVARGRGRLARAARLGEPAAQQLQLARQVLGRGVALLGVLGEAALDEPAEGSRHARRRLQQRLGLLADDRDERLGARLALEGLPPGGHLVEDRAERELVRAEVHGAAGGLLGRHVAHRPEHGAGLRARDRRRHVRPAPVGLRLDQLGEAEVQDLQVAVARQHQVLGLQVAVDDAVRVRAGEGARRLRGELEELAQRQRLLRERLAQRAALHELHRDVERAGLVADVEHRHDVRVVERRRGAGLALEALAAVLARGELGPQPLDRDLAPEPRVARAEHLAHATRAERAQDLVGSEARAGGEGLCPGRSLVGGPRAHAFLSSRFASVTAPRQGSST